MAEIPWWVWIGVGLFVTIASAVVGGRMYFFIWIGLIFMIVGIVKAVFLFVFRERETKQEQKTMQAPAMHMPRQTHCPRCRVATTLHDNFCRYCGQKLR